MTKEFVPFELALKLQKLGFDEDCLGFYDGFMYNEIAFGWTQSPNKAPTLQQAFRWFRDEHGVSIYVSPLEDGSAFYHMVYTNINVPFSNRICSLPSKWNTHEEAELACLDKLIEIVEERNNTELNNFIDE